MNMKNIVVNYENITIITIQKKTKKNMKHNTAIITALPYGPSKIT